jgi:two-component system chemotaxis sensor kinase CheA
MPNISELTEQLAATVVLADPTDLPALANVHDQLQALAQVVGELTDIDKTRISSLQHTAKSAENLVERIILRDVEDAAVALRSVSETITELKALIEDPTRQITIATVAKESTATVEPQHAPAAVEADIAINPDDVPLVLEFITESFGHIESAEAAVLQLEEDPHNLEVVNAIFRSFHTIKGVAGFLNLKQIGALAHAAENLLDLARHEKLLLAGAIIDVVLEAIDLVKVLVNSLNDAVKTGAAPEPQARLAGLLTKLHAAASGKLEAGAAAATPAASQEAGAADATPAASREARTEPEAKPKAAAGSSGPAGEQTVKVATDRLDSLINMVGELVIAQSMAGQDVHASAGNQRLTRNMAHLGKLTRELQDLSMSMRMVPIQGVFQKMTRLVRDVARKALKEIDFSVVGGETELDRNIVEAISDPLVHMVRNSVDHGIEPPDQRAQLDKPRAGRIQLKAYHHSGNIVIEISDDGRGLNKARILKKAIDNGIVREGQELSDQEIFKLVFAAGLSTAEKVTDISGRGVGMDVVKRNVEALRGRIDIASTEGKGSIFTIRLPLTLAVIDGQVLKVGTHRYIIPITSIVQTIQPKPEQLSSVQGRGEMCIIRGSLLPLFRVHKLFNVKPITEDPTKSLIVIVQNDLYRCCLLVDELLGQQQVVIKSLGDVLGNVPGISGGAILGDGNVSLILDIPGLIQLAAGKKQGII